MSMRVRRALVTGGTGFVGGVLVRRLVLQGAEVHVIVRPGTALGRLPAGTVIHECCLDDAGAVRRCVDDSRPTHVFHLACDSGAVHRAAAGLHPAFLVGELTRAMNLFAALRDCGTPPDALVLAGSLAEYGDGPAPAREGQRERPRGSYALAKTNVTHLAQVLARDCRHAVQIARLALVYGFGQREDFFIPGLMRDLVAARPFTIRAPGHRRDLIHVDDAAAGLLALAAGGAPTGSIVNICSGTAPTMREVADEVVAVSGCDPRLVRVAPGDPAGMPLVLGDPALARRLIGWRPGIGLREGLRRTFESMTSAGIAA